MMRKFLCGVLATLLLAFPSPVSAAPSQQAVANKQLTADQWREDLRFMATEMKRRHASLFHSTSREAFDAAVADLDRRIPSLERNDIIVGMMRIAAMVGDGHTRVDPRKDKAFGFASLPIKLYDFDDGIYVRAAGPGNETLLGARVKAVGGVPIRQAVERIKPLVSGDNQMSARLMVPLYLAMPDILEAVGLSNRSDSTVFTLVRDGKSWDVKLTAEGVDPVWPPDTDISLITPDGWVDARTGPPPLWLQDPLVLHRLETIPGKSLVYAQLNQGTDYKGESLDAFGDRIAKAVRENNPHFLVFDVRLNYGGNGDLRHELIRNLIRSEDDDTRLFILTARGSFSATQFYLDDLARLSHGLFVGEPAAGKAISYGDAYRSMLPNSGIAVRSSTRYWQDGQDHRPWTPIDIAVPYKFADYVAGRDPVLETVMAYQPEPSLLERLNIAAQSQAKGQVVRVLDEWNADPRHIYADRPGDGVRYIQQMTSEASALEASRWLAQHYPAYGDAQTLLALLAESQGNKDLALRAARSAVAINPDDRQSRSVIERLASSH